MPSDDPYAQYLTPPGGAASATGGDDPYAKYLTPPGGATAATVQPSNAYQRTWLDKMTNVANPTLGLGDLLASGVGQGIEALGGKNLMPSVAEAKAQRAQDFADVGPIAGTAASIAGYGPMGAVLGPAGATSALAGRPIAQAAAEGALAGGISDFDPSDPIGSTLHGATMGGALGGAAGGLAKGAGKLLTKTPELDPAAVVASTKGTRDAAYDALNKIPANPDHVDQAIGKVMSGLDPSVETGMSGTLKGQIKDIRQALQEQGTLGKPVNIGQVDSWQRQINDAANRERYPTDGIVAGRINEALDGLIQSHGAGDLQDAAQAAHQNYAAAQDLQDWQTRAKAGAGIGQAPLTESEKPYYQNQPEKIKTLVDLYQQGQQGASKLTYGLGHLGATVAGFGGHAVAGFPGAVGSELLWYLAGKPALYKAMKGYDKGQFLKGLQRAYPSLTGVRLPPSTPPSPAVGELIKNLMIGTAY